MTTLVKILFNSSRFYLTTYFNKLFLDSQLTNNTFPNPTWRGKLSSKLKLENKVVTIKDLISLTNFIHPDTLNFLPLLAKKSSTTVAIYDWVISAPKSLSLLESLFPNSYSQIHHNAVNKAVEIIEEFAKVKIPNYYSSKSFEVITQKIATTQFFHVNTLNNKVNLHTHVIILNLLSTFNDTYRQYKLNYFLEVLHNATIVYNNEIAKGLLEKNLSFNLKKTPWHECTNIEIANFPKEILTKHSLLDNKLLNSIPFYKNTQIKEITLENYFTLVGNNLTTPLLPLKELYLQQNKTLSLSIAKQLIALHKQTLFSPLLKNTPNSSTTIIQSPNQMAKILDQYSELIFRREVLYSYDFYIYCFFSFYFPGRVSFDVLHNAIFLSTKLMHITFNGIQSIVITKKFYHYCIKILNTIENLSNCNIQYLINTTKVNSPQFFDSIKDFYSNSIPQNIVTCSEEILQKPNFLTIVTNLDNNSFSLLILAVAGIRKLTIKETPTFLISNDPMYPKIFKDLLPVKSLDLKNSSQYQFPNNSLIFVDPSIFNDPYDCFTLITNCAITPNIRIIFCQFNKEITPYINSLWYYLKSLPHTQIIHFCQDKNPATLYYKSNSSYLNKTKLTKHLNFHTVNLMYQINLIKLSINFLEDAANCYINTIKDNLSLLGKTCLICDSTKDQLKLNKLIQQKLDSLNLYSQITSLHKRSNNNFSPLPNETVTLEDNNELFPNPIRIGQTFIKIKVALKLLNDPNYLTANKTIQLTQNVSNFGNTLDVLTISSTNSKRVFFTNNTNCLKSRLLGKYITGKLTTYYYQPGDLLINLFPISSPLGDIPVGSQFIALKEQNCYKYLDPAWPTIGRIVEVNAPIFTLGYALVKDKLYNLKFDTIISTTTSLSDSLFTTLKKRTTNTLLFYTPNYLKFIENLDNLTKEEEDTLSSIASLQNFDNDDFALVDRPLVLIHQLLQNKNQRKLIEQIAFGIKE